MPFKKDVTIALMVPFHLGGYSYQEIPVNPNRISFTTGHRVIRPTVLGIGELNQVGPRKLKTIVWSSHFPEFTDTYVNYPASSLQTPKWWKDRFEGYQHKPLTLAITNIGLIEKVQGEGTYPQLHFSAPCMKGCSGSPIFNMDGDVIGVLFGGTVESKDLPLQLHTSLRFLKAENGLGTLAQDASSLVSQFLLEEGAN